MAAPAPTVPPGTLLPQEESLALPDWSSLGLILAIVGCFLIANAILFRDPRALVREHFGAGRGDLRSVRDYVFHRVQTTLGFTYLLAGFALQLYGRLRPLPAEVEGSFPVLWIGVVVVLTGLLQTGGWWWSLFAFRRAVRRHFAESPPDFEADARTAREVGELFGVQSHGDETVQSYAARLRERLRLPAHVAAREPERPRVRLDERGGAYAEPAYEER